jgi:hypothetical protein
MPAIFLGLLAALVAACSPSIRFQDPTPPFNYLSEEVRFKSGQVSLAGTLSLPSSAGPFPAVLLISGAGPQNRNEEVYGHRPFWVIADYLTRRGYAVLRVDDRGTGASTGVFDRNLTLDTLVGDTLAGVGYLQQRSEIRQNSIGLLGHSQGGLIASLVARQTSLAFVISLGAPAVNEGQVIIESNRLIARLEEVAEPLIALQSNLFEHVQRLSLEGASAEGIVAYLKNSLSQEQRQALGLSDAEIERLARQYASPYARSVLSLNPIASWQALNIPVLALFGELDLQVSAAQNEPPLSQAFAGKEDTSIQVLTKLNHLFQNAITGHPKEYAELEETLSPQVLKLIGDWLDKRF